MNESSQVTIKSTCNPSVRRKTRDFKISLCADRRNMNCCLFEILLLGNLRLIAKKILHFFLNNENLSNQWVHLLKYYFKCEPKKKIVKRKKYVYYPYFLFIVPTYNVSFLKGLAVRVLWHINLCRLFNAKSILIQMHNSISSYSVWHESTV